MTLFITAHTPVGGALWFSSATGRESLSELSELFEYRVQLKSGSFSIAPDDIVKEVLGKYPVLVDDRLSGHYRPWDCFVRYRESDFHFVHRLMEHERIYYFFAHAAGSSTLVLAMPVTAATTTASGSQPSCRQRQIHHPASATSRNPVPI
ncbi:contractile injection system protein, VgrG/Pvc8 family [Sphingomonas sp. NCPPB 2930]